MNTNRRSDDSWIIFSISGVVALFAYLVWQFSTLFELDMSTGASIFFRLLFLAALVGGTWWFGNDFDIIKLINIWPIVLAFFWACWWPALDYWSSQTGVRFSATIWWAAWYTKGGIFAAILGLGYLGKIVLQSDY